MPAIQAYIGSVFMFVHPTGRRIRKSPHVVTARRPPRRVPRRGSMPSIRLKVARIPLGQNVSFDNRRVGSGKSMPASMICEKFARNSCNPHPLVLGTEAGGAQ